MDNVFEIDGSTSTCKYCGTQYDIWAVDIEDFIPPVGDGCEYCDPELDYDDMWEFNDNA